MWYAAATRSDRGSRPAPRPGARLRRGPAGAGGGRRGGGGRGAGGGEGGAEEGRSGRGEERSPRHWGAAGWRQDDTVAVIGLGYVGLPLAISFAEAGLEVEGIDASSAPGRRAQRRPLPDRRHHERAAGRRAGGWAARRRAGRGRASTRPTRSSSASRRRSPRPRTPTSRPVLARGRDDPRQPPRRASSSSSSRRPSPARRPARSARSLERSGLHAGADFDLAFAPGAGQPGRPGERQQGRPAPRRRDHARGDDARGRAAAQHQRQRRRALVARRRRARQAARERLPQRQHRARQPARPAVRADGPRRLGGHRRRGDQAVRVHAVHARARASAATASRSTRTTCRGGRASSTSSTASSSSPATSTSRCRATSSTSSPRRSTTAARRSRAPGSASSASPSSRTSATRATRRRPTSSPGSPSAAPTSRFHDPHVASFTDAAGTVREASPSTSCSTGPDVVVVVTAHRRSTGTPSTPEPTSSSTRSTARAGGRRAAAAGPAPRRRLVGPPLTGWRPDRPAGLDRRPRAVLLIANTAAPVLAGAARRAQPRRGRLGGRDRRCRRPGRRGRRSATATSCTRRFRPSGIFRRWSDQPPTPKPPTRSCAASSVASTRASRPGSGRSTSAAGGGRLRRGAPARRPLSRLRHPDRAVALELAARPGAPGGAGIVVYDVIDAILDSNNYQHVPGPLLDRYRPRRRAGCGRSTRS